MLQITYKASYLTLADNEILDIICENNSILHFTFELNVLYLHM